MHAGFFFLQLGCVRSTRGTARWFGLLSAWASFFRLVPGNSWMSEERFRGVAFLVATLSFFSKREPVDLEKLDAANEVQLTNTRFENGYLQQK
jgi:hypothetical protein